MKAKAEKMAAESKAFQADSDAKESGGQTSKKVKTKEKKLKEKKNLKYFYFSLQTKGIDLGWSLSTIAWSSQQLYQRSCKFQT